MKHRHTHILQLTTLALAAAAAGCGSTHNTKTTASLPQANITATTTRQTFPTPTSGAPIENPDPTAGPIEKIAQHIPVELSTWGHEATPSEKREVASLIKRYFTAIATSNGKAACPLLHPYLANAIIEDAHSPTSVAYLPTPTCPTAMSKYLHHLYAQAHPTSSFTNVTVTHLRIKPPTAYAQAHSPAYPEDAIPLRRNNNKWTIYTRLP